LSELVFVRFFYPNVILYSPLHNILFGRNFLLSLHVASKNNICNYLVRLLKYFSIFQLHIYIIRFS
jgi:hypothetical protein